MSAIGIKQWVIPEGTLKGKRRNRHPRAKASPYNGTRRPPSPLRAA